MKHDYIVVNHLEIISFCSRKWTFRLIFLYFNLAVRNYWIKYQTCEILNGSYKTMDLPQFTKSLLESLTFSYYSIKHKRLYHLIQVFYYRKVKTHKPYQCMMCELRWYRTLVGIKDDHKQLSKLETCKD